MNKNLSLLKSIKHFLMQQKIIGININLFVFEILIEILYKNDWFRIRFVLFKIIQFYAVACIGAGWHIVFYKDHVNIHAKRVIICLSWWEKNCFKDIKYDWRIARMNYEQLKEFEKRIHEIKKMIK